ncbi:MULTISPECIES: hypothetical protein [unclassified Frankia]|uniref:hypothetical protein n=1 Tax=unclassified Frankia TaxID=2632575 RepID=UPI002AD3B105|nr:MULTISPECIES: hypothetical protein [unclassified Frankia]
MSHAALLLATTGRMVVATGIANRGHQPTSPLHRVLAALGPKMLTLAAELTEGAHTYTVPVEHTQFAWGTIDDIARRVKEHLDAGADHVALQVLLADPTALPLPEWRELAALLD